MMSSAAATFSFSAFPERAAPYRRIPWLVVLLVAACLAGQAVAVTAGIQIPVPPRAEGGLIEIETLITDSRTPVLEDGRWLTLAPDELELRALARRDASTTSSSLPTAETLTTTFQLSDVKTASASATNTASSSSSSSSATTPATSNAPLPSPLDGSLSSNFTSGCASFINGFLKDQTFKQCYPFSILLTLPPQTFFNDEKSIVSISQVLDASCSANVTFCSDYLASLAQNFTSSANCATDYNQGNAVVMQTYTAMVAYAPLYDASCLKDPKTSVYCYATAVTNTTNASNVYFYYLPLNSSLPGATVPTCNACLQQTMSDFQATCANRKQPIADTYRAAAQQVNTVCGPGFANETLPAALVVSGAWSARLASSSGLLVAVAGVWAAQWLLLA